MTFMEAKVEIFYGCNNQTTITKMDTSQHNK